MREDDVVLKVLVLFRVVLVEALLPPEVFDVSQYYSERLVIRQQINGTSFSIAAQSKERALAHLAPIAPNCSVDVEEVRACDSKDDSLCRQSSPESSWQSYSYFRDSCDCYLGSCGEWDPFNFTETVLYPGCTCNKSYSVEPCDFKSPVETCPQWKDLDDKPLVFNIYHPKQFHRFTSFVQAGSKNMTFDRKRVSMVSSVFRQSGINCALRFEHHFTPQSISSNLIVRAHLQNGENHTLYEYNYVFPTVKTDWVPTRVLVGSYSQPFWLSIDCETGAPPKKRNRKQKDFACGLAAIEFESCSDIGNPLETCQRGDQFLCSTPSHTKCLRDTRCDMKPDCEDGSDEIDCDNMPPGSMCDFNKQDFCEGWKRRMRILGNQESQFEPTTLAPANKLDDTHKYLLKITNPGLQLGVKKPARHGSGSMLYYESGGSRGKLLSRRTSVLESPVFPRTNPDAYNPKSRLFQTCKLRFYVCAKTFSTTWHISIISKTGIAFDSGRTALYESKAFDLNYEPKSNCEWKRRLVTVPRQNGGFRLGIFVEHHFDVDDFLALDDLSFSPSCFEKDVNQSSWETPNVLISTCGASGFEKPHNCGRYRELDGQTGHFMKEDGTQEWTVPLSGFYRIEACGAAGGSNELASGERGECVTLQVHLRENIALRMLIGQMGESPCLAEQEEDLRPGSCASSSETKREERAGGAGGGGATLIKVEEKTWNVVAGGGAGASWSSADTKSGYGASVTKVEIDEKCTEVCRSVSHENFFVEKTEHQCPHKENQTTVFGGFGGGGNSCGMLGGSGAGYRAGSPFAAGRNRSGSSNVTENFSKQVMYFQAATNEDGFIRISFCRKHCPAPSVCRFDRDKEFEEEYCGCPDGSEYKNTSESCACSLNCPAASTCQYRNFTFEPFCMCNNGKFINDFSQDACEESQSWRWYNYLFSFFILLVLTVAVVVVFHYRNSTKKIKEELFHMSTRMTTSNDYCYDDIYFGTQTRKEAIERLPPIERDCLRFGRVLGKGNFGEVLYGEYNEQKLAVKSISKPFSASLSAQADFCNEALCMGTFVHENVVKLIGVDFSKLPYIIAIEFMEGGDLLSFVKDARPNQVSLNPFHLTMSDLIKITCGVASGCKCLETYGYVHRDIAARNILLTSRGLKRVAKIADFGMAKEITYGSEYYRVHGRAMLPIKWTPPEAFIDGVFTTKSDIWSFGILCWEVFSLGVVPYPNRRNEEVMLMLTEGARLEYPYGIPTRVYQLMRECWRTASDHRPTFVQVVDSLNDILQDTASIGMPFPIHPTVRASYAHAQSTPVSVETPMTTMTDVSLSSTFTEAATVKVNTQQDVQDRINLHELMLTREQPYTSEMASCVVDNLRKDLARAQFETGMTSVPQPECLSPESIDESVQLIGSCITDQTPPTSQVDLNRLAVQDTGPTLHRPDSLNINDYYSSVPLLECQTR